MSRNLVRKFELRFGFEIDERDVECVCVCACGTKDWWKVSFVVGGGGSVTQKTPLNHNHVSVEGMQVFSWNS